MGRRRKADAQLFNLLSNLLQQVEALTNQEEVELRSKSKPLGLEVTKVLQSQHSLMRYNGAPFESIFQSGISLPPFFPGIKCCGCYMGFCLSFVFCFSVSSYICLARNSKGVG
ncbi:hypothetical protein Ddye_031944 [Dipteronia dyeriana]|uniref:Uncharacterized protein n=1 Tax=Dipteronia dyeriana TaxID=168575 RepID=A0AAD9TJY0_9ROSI|nr:hypothetical protein Ddye_031944 [Dipteronia dyeriana]